MLPCELLTRASDVVVSWVKGPTKEVDVARGTTARDDKIGNDGADELAVAGAALHHVSAEVVDAGRARRAMAKRAQKMKVAILLERRIQENYVLGEGLTCVLMRRL